MPPLFAATLTTALLLGFAQSPDASSRVLPEALAVIVNPANAVEELSMEELRKLFLQERRTWDQRRRVTVLITEPSQPEYRVLLDRVYRMSASQLTRYFLQAEFTGENKVPPRRLADADAVRRFVAYVPGAIGVVPVTQVDASVKTVRLDGRMPGDPDYHLLLR